MAQTSLNSTGVASSGALVLQSNGTTTAVTIGTDQAVTTANTINGLTVGKGAGSVASNTAVGASALNANSTGPQVTAVGYQALLNSTGGYNTALGYQAGSGVTTPDSITAIGRGVMSAGTVTGGDNTGVGNYALNVLSTGTSNVAVGGNAMTSNTTGSTNTALGRQALQANTTASNNTAVGYQAAYSNTTGTAINAFGYQALYSNTTGTNNTGVGQNVMALNTTGSYNVAVGELALRGNTTASYNTAVGYQAGYTSTTGAGNQLFGYRAGYALTTGSANTFVGSGSGNVITTGNNNTIVGAYTGNQGGLDIRTASNYIVLSDGDGNPLMWRNASYSWFINSTQTSSELYFAINGSGKASIYWDNTASRLYTYTNTNGPYVANGGTSWTNSSDERLKNITGEIQNGLSKVCYLRAAEYTWKNDESATPQVGLIAQDVLAVLPEAVEAPEEGTLDRDGNPAMMGVQYTNVIPLLVAAIKELKAEIDILKGQA